MSATADAGTWDSGGITNWAGVFGDLLGALRKGSLASVVFLSGSSEQSSYIYHFTNDAGRVGIKAAGIVFPSSNGFAYFTTVAYSSGARAQAMQALNSTPTGYFKFERSNVPGLTYRGQVQPWYGQPGGGPEYVVPGPVRLGDAQWNDIGK